MDAEFFGRGLTPAEFIASLGDYRAKFEQHMAESATEAADTARQGNLPRGTKVAVIAEPWSGDVLYNLPPLLRLAEAAGWEVRIFPRDSYPELILPYRKDGLYHSIPVFIFFDSQFNELGAWIERPEAATRLIDQESLALRRRLREEHKEAWRQAALSEISLMFRPAPEE